jgi:hypothetical protein
MSQSCEKAPYRKSLPSHYSYVIIRCQEVLTNPIKISDRAKSVTTGLATSRGTPRRVVVIAEVG